MLIFFLLLPGTIRRRALRVHQRQEGHSQAGVLLGDHARSRAAHALLQAGFGTRGLGVSDQIRATAEWIHLMLSEVITHRNKELILGLGCGFEP